MEVRRETQEVKEYIWGPEGHLGFREALGEQLERYSRNNPGSDGALRAPPAPRGA